MRAFRLQNDAPAKTGAQAANISLVVTKGAEDLGQALWVAWIDWSKSIGQYVPLDPQRKPQWMPASFYPRKEKATDFSSSIVVAWNTGVQLVKLRRDREAIALDMVHLYKLCVHSLDRMQVCARGFEGFAPGACELCGSIEGLGLLMCCTCCLLDMHVGCAQRLASLPHSQSEINSAQMLRGHITRMEPEVFACTWRSGLCSLCHLVWS